MIPPCSSLMLGVWRAVTLKALKILHLANLKRRSRLSRPGRHCIFRCLKWLAVPLVCQIWRLIRNPPISADRSSMTLLASPRRGNALPRHHHGAAALHQHNTCRKHQIHCFHWSPLRSHCSLLKAYHMTSVTQSFSNRLNMSVELLRFYRLIWL